MDQMMLLHEVFVVVIETSVVSPKRSGPLPDIGDVWTISPPSSLMIAL